MGDFPQVQTRVDIKKLHAQTSSTALRRHSFSDCLLRSGNMGTKQEHERMIQSTQRKMLRLIIQTKRKYKKIEKQDIGPKEENGKVDITEMCSTDDGSGEGQSTRTQNDVDSEQSFEDDADEEIDINVIEEEDWIEYTKRSTEDAMEKMAHAKIRCWNRTNKKNNMEIGTERWLKKAAEWNPDLSSRYRTNRAIGRPRKRWEDDINEFLKQEFEENENPIERDNQTNKTWINIAKDRRRALLEENYTMTV